MSSSKSKSKDKRAAGKEPLKSPAKPTTNANNNGGVPASGYNPLMGTFHTLETAPLSSVLPVHVNRRFGDIDDADDPSGNFVGTGLDSDCVSNNGSWSGESEDPKDKGSQGPGSSHQETTPGVDNDKREKIRQKNEKKHQRQKERRAQELHERCCGYLTSRKLDTLAQQLVSMGFPLEQATMALYLNEGRIEESVAWLFEGGEDTDNQRDHNLESGSNLKVDISQELDQIVKMEVKFKCSKQEVERAVVACEGDLEQAEENLKKVHKQESHTGPSKPTINQTSSTPKVQSKPNSSSGSIPIQQKVDDKDSTRSSAELGSKNIQLLKKVNPTSDWAKHQQSVTNPSVDKRWVAGGLTPLQAAVPPSKTETHHASIGNELKNLQLGSVTMMQRPQSKLSSSSSSASHFSDWNSNGFPSMPSSTRSFNQRFDQIHYQHRQQPHYVSSGSLLDHQSSQPIAMNHLNNNGSWNRMVDATPTLAPASSLGLFTGSGLNGVSGPSHVDWNAGWSSQFDYTNVDWSLNRVPSRAGSVSRPNGMWIGPRSLPGTDPSGRLSTTVLGNVSSVLHPDGVGGSEPVGGGSSEWTSPFEEKDLFSLPRQNTWGGSLNRIR